MVGPTTSTWFALRKLRPTTASMNANRRTGKPEGWDDAVAALNPHLDHQLFQQGFPLARRSVEHGVTESFFHVAHDFGGRSSEHLCAVGFPQVFRPHQALGRSRPPAASNPKS